MFSSFSSRLEALLILAAPVFVASCTGDTQPNSINNPPEGNGDSGNGNGGNGEDGENQPATTDPVPMEEPAKIDEEQAAVGDGMTATIAWPAGQGHEWVLFREAQFSESMPTTATVTAESGGRTSSLVLRSDSDGTVWGLPDDNAFFPVSGDFITVSVIDPAGTIPLSFNGQAFGLPAAVSPGYDSLAGQEIRMDMQVSDDRVATRLTVGLNVAAGSQFDADYDIVLVTPDGGEYILADGITSAADFAQDTTFYFYNQGPAGKLTMPPVDEGEYDPRERLPDGLSRYGCWQVKIRSTSQIVLSQANWSINSLPNTDSIC